MPMVQDDGEVGRNRRLRPQASLDLEDDSKVGRPRRSRRLRPQASLDPEDDIKVSRPCHSRRLRPRASLDPVDDGEVGRPRRSRRLRPQASLDPEDDGEVGRPHRSRRLRPQASLDPEDDNKRKQQKSMSVASSCCSSRPTQLIKGGKSLPANMPKKGKQQAIHHWTPAEQKQLWEFAKELCALWPEKMLFYKTLADKMNEQNQKDGYVALDQIKVKDKFTNFRGRYALYLKGKALENDTLYKEHGGTMSSFFTSGAGTSSGSVSVGGSTKTRKKMSAPEQHRTALAHLISNNIGGAILVEYSAILRFADVLDPFFQFEDIEGQINFLNSCLAA